MEQGGWIKLYRRMLDNPICCRDADYFSVWIYLLLNAVHKDTSIIFQGKKVVLKPGQLVTGRQAIAKKFKIAESKVQRILIELTNEKQIQQETSSRSRIITVLGWESYQSMREMEKTVEQQFEQQIDFSKADDEKVSGFFKENLNNSLNNKWTTNEQQNEQQFEQQIDFSKADDEKVSEISTSESEQQFEQQNFAKVNTIQEIINNNLNLNINNKSDLEKFGSFEEFEKAIKDLPYEERLKAQSHYMAIKYGWKK